ncbi:hypothetical protein FACS1894178_7560 [Bacteroidia bacterium]|nr:hypothetical protein FACS1894178_7560 [Bacteroidia bacterium]
MNSQITVKLNLGGATPTKPVNIWAWTGGTNHTGGVWPGAAMNNDGDGWYSYVLNVTGTVEVMFSHGTAADANMCQTPGGIAITQNTCFQWALLAGVQATTVACNSAPPSGDGVTIRWRKGADVDWANMGIYAWTGSVQFCGAWPGAQVAPDGDGWYEYTFTETPEHIMFNNYIATTELGGKEVNGPVSQTSDICLEIHPIYYCIANCETGNAPCSELEHFTVKWDNAQGWNDMYIYAWMGNEGITELFGAYPGEAVTPTNGFYSKTFVKATPVNMIFISPTNAAQTANIMGVLDDACYTITPEIEYNELEQATNVAQQVINCNYSSVKNLLANDIVITPNPVKDFIVIDGMKMVGDGSKLLVEIFDINGKQYHTTSYKLLQTPTKISVADLPQGVYFLKIGNVIKKFVKE